MRATTLAVSLVFIVFFNSVSFAVNSEGIVGIWLLDEGKGDVAADSSDHKRDGQKMDAANWVKGKFGNALDFSESQASRVDIPDDPALDLITFSITAWVNIGKTGTWGGGDQLLVGKIDQANRSLRNYTLFVDKDTFSPHFSANGGKDYPSAGANTGIGDEKWHHVAVTYDKKFIRGYQDGKQVAEMASSAIPDTNDFPLVIGGIPQWPTVMGIVDEVGVFNQALTPAVIKYIMEKGLIEGIAYAVSPKGKLATFWGKLKVEPEN